MNLIFVYTILYKYSIDSSRPLTSLWFYGNLYSVLSSESSGQAKREVAMEAITIITLLIVFSTITMLFDMAITWWKGRK